MIEFKCKPWMKIGSSWCRPIFHGIVYHKGCDIASWTQFSFLVLGLQYATEAVGSQYTCTMSTFSEAYTCAHNVQPTSVLTGLCRPGPGRPIRPAAGPGLLQWSPAPAWNFGRFTALVWTASPNLKTIGGLGQILEQKIGKNSSWNSAWLSSAPNGSYCG